jgi:hypothetical protein
VKAPWARAYSCVWHMIVVWAMLLPAVVLAEAKPASQPAGNPGDGELILESKYIERLVLLDPQGQRKDITAPGPKMFLPPGQYIVQEVYFQGGFSIKPYTVFTSASKEVFKLDIGASLKPSVTVKREGRLLKLDYRLLKADGQPSINSDRSHPPEFAVYQGDEKIGSGKFEYG